MKGIDYLMHIKCAKKIVMTITNKYIKRLRIFGAKFREYIRHFSLDLDAHKIAL